MKNLKLNKEVWIILFYLLTPYYLLLSFIGCGLNNPFTPPEPPKPNAPILVNPKDGYELDPTKGVNFSWNPVPHALQYRLQVSYTSTFDPSPDSTPVDTLIKSFYFKHTFTKEAKYYWRVRAQVRRYMAWSDWSEVWSFSAKFGANSPPLVPDTPNPPNGARNVALTWITFSWKSGDPDGDPLRYIFYFGTDSFVPDSFSSFVDSSGAKEKDVAYDLWATFDPAVAETFRLKPNTNYFWKIKVQDLLVDSVRHEVDGPIWTFTTGGDDNHEPLKPSSPTALPPWRYWDEAFEFRAHTTDPDTDSLSYLFYYDYRVDPTATSGWTDWAPSGESVSITHTYNRVGKFSVRVRAQDIYYRRSSISDSTAVITKSRAGACWAADYNNNRAIKLAQKIGAEGAKLWELCTFSNSPMPTGHLQFAQPFTLGVAPEDGYCWIACSYVNRVFLVDPQGWLFNWKIYGGQNPSTPCPDGHGNCWLVLAWVKKLIKVDKNFQTLKTIIDNLGGAVHPTAMAIDIEKEWGWVAEPDLTPPGGAPGYISKFDLDAGARILCLPGFKAFPAYLDVDPSTHYCWVPDNGNNRVAKISPDGATISYFDTACGEPFLHPICVSVDHNMGWVWVADSTRVVKLSTDGAGLCHTRGLSPTIYPYAVEADLLDHGCWVSDAGNQRVVKLNDNCEIVAVDSGYVNPVGLSFNPNPDP